MVELETKLLEFLNGKAKPADFREQLTLGNICAEYKGLNFAAVRFYSDAFAARPDLFNNPLTLTPHRYDASCAAALAGCGQGLDAYQLDSKERARIRRQALDWLRADLASYRQLLDEEPDKARALITQRMQHWQQDKDFAGVRGTGALAKLPEAERAEWSKLWQEVAALGKQAADGKVVRKAAAIEAELVPMPKEVKGK